MRKLAVAGVVLLSIVAAVLVWRPLAARDALAPADRAPSDAEPFAPRDLPPVDRAPRPDEAAPTDARTELAAADAAADAARAAWPRCQVRGRVLDVHGLPIDGAELRLNTVGEAWVQPHEFDGEVGATRATSDAAGRFAFDVALPSSSWISLRVGAPPFHVKSGRDFGLAGGRNEPPLVPGDNDLGDFVLAAAGAFRGRVLDEAGRPVGDARVRLEGVFPGGYGVSGTSDASGAYEVAGAPAGRYVAKALAEGWLNAEVAGVEIEDGRVTSDVDFTLRAAPTLRGRVVDDDGAPLADVRLWGWPRSSGTGAGARTRADGTFTVHLPQRSAYSLGATLRGYEPISDRAGVWYEPDTRDLELVMHRAALVTYRVRDARTDAPVTRFGLRVLRVRSADGGTSSSDDHDPARVEEHADGEVERPGDPRWDDYTVVAPGYADQRGRVAFDVAGVPVVTVRLQPGGRLRGRATAGGAPVPFPLLELRADRVPLRPGVTSDEDDIFSSDWGSDLDAFAGRLRQATGDETGAFELPALAAGTYELVLRARGLAPRTLERLVVAVGETRDLGDVALARPASIVGRLLLGATSPAGVSVALGDEHFADDESAQVLDATGAFRFDDLAAGTHHVWVEPKAGVVLAGPPVPVEVADGEEHPLLLELPERVPCRLEVRVRLNGAPAPDVAVEVRLESAPRRAAARSVRTDAQGLAVLEAPGEGDARVHAYGPAGLYLGRAEATVALAGGAARVAALDLAAGDSRSRCRPTSASTCASCRSRAQTWRTPRRSPCCSPAPNRAPPRAARATAGLGHARTLRAAAAHPDARPARRGHGRAGETATCALAP
ncbi:MAG: carboxypeptidase regulatory-like domain-containing protein [Planctomycetes bacterium]|nr:carboxypeptidase regulatory-like domain-containing protein [Planctomycetota bacterium]